MKILSRLRALSPFQRLTGLEPAVSQAIPSIDRDETDLDGCFDGIGDDGLLDFEAGGGTVDGLRRRIPDLHEDFPPDVLGVEEQGESL